MKKNILLLLTIVLTQFISAQNDSIKRKETWLDFQVVQHFGLDQWSNIGYINDGFSRTAFTELRAIGNYNLGNPYVGAFIDMGAGLMPAPKMKSLNLDNLPMPYSGKQYYLREILSESGKNGTSPHFKMTFGLFGTIPAKENLSVMSYFGIGFITMPQREYEIILKEQDSNMQYKTTYIWNYKNDDSSNNYKTALGYLTGRLSLKHKISSKSNLLVGLEYTYFFSTLDFYAKYTNTFNANIERDFIITGNKMNMFGISVGISL